MPGRPSTPSCRGAWGLHRGRFANQPAQVYPLGLLPVPCYTVDHHRRLLPQAKQAKSNCLKAITNSPIVSGLMGEFVILQLAKIQMGYWFRKESGLVKQDCDSY